MADRPASPPDAHTTAVVSDPALGSTGGAAATDPPLRHSVIMVGQRSLLTQRRKRFVAGSNAHPARMAPDLAAALIRDYTAPGDWVLDPLVGIGTTLVEAIHADRHSVGVEIHPGWATLARANIGLARRQGGTGTGRVITADATLLPRRIPMSIRGRFALVLVAPPYGLTMRGQIPRRRESFDRLSGRVGRRSPGRPPRSTRITIADGIGAILAGCATLLAPNGVVAVVSRPGQHGPVLTGIPRQIIHVADAVGLQFIQDRRVSHVASRHAHLVDRHHFFQLHVTGPGQTAERAAPLPQHDHIAVFCRPSRG